MQLKHTSLQESVDTRLSSLRVSDRTETRNICIKILIKLLILNCLTNSILVSIPLISLLSPFIAMFFKKKRNQLICNATQRGKTTRLNVIMMWCMLMVNRKIFLHLRWFVLMFNYIQGGDRVACWPDVKLHFILAQRLKKMTSIYYAFMEVKRKKPMCKL